MRARNIKPGFFISDQLSECDAAARLLFIGLWCCADREGRLEDRPRRIKVDVLPYDNVDIDALLSQLADQKLIIRYEVGGERYIQVVKFTKHQNPHYKEPPSVIPPMPGWEDSGYVVGAASESVRQEVFERDGRTCQECGATEDLSLDHIIPRSKGGTNEPENLRTLCRRCNSAKNNREASANLKEASANDRPSIGQASADENLADTGYRIPDSLTPDCLMQETTAAAREDEPIELSLTELEVAARIKSVPGMGHVSDVEVIAHIREVIRDRGYPVSERAVLADAGRFRDHWIEKRAKAPPGKWKGWKVAISNWFERTKDVTDEPTRNGSGPRPLDSRNGRDAASQTSGNANGASQYLDDPLAKRSGIRAS